MKICLAQSRPVKGDIEQNVAGHKKLIDLAISSGANVIIFPELSLTGYEPQLAQDLAVNKDDQLFDIFQDISDNMGIITGVGVPLKSSAGICISMIIFQPYTKSQVYSKRYLHPDEEGYFVRAHSSRDTLIKGTQIAPAICYEISVPQHSGKAVQKGAKVYLASVAKSARGVYKATNILSEIAQKYRITVLMVNCVGQVADFVCAGNSSVWTNDGKLLGQLDGVNEGILIYDLQTLKITIKTI